MKNAKDIADAAQEAFWAKVVELVPEAGTGDFDPLAAVNFDRCCEAAVEHWLECNVPRRRRYEVRVTFDVSRPLTVGDRDHIAEVGNNAVGNVLDELIPRGMYELTSTMLDEVDE